MDKFGGEVLLNENSSAQADVSLNATKAVPLYPRKLQDAFVL